MVINLGMNWENFYKDNIMSYIKSLQENPIELIALIIDGIIDHKFPHLLWAILYGICGTILFSLNMFFLLFMSYLGHIGMTMSEVDKIHRASGFDKNTDLGFYLTVIGSFLIGAYKDSLK